MHWELINWNWNETVFFKALLSLLFGFILGVERELKDKAAGLRTITIISLGSTLFTILSYKIGLETGFDTTRIASYVVSGIGFLGAGVIFKDGISINGLTTASIIWVAAAIGMSVGFGQYSTAIIFLAASLIIIYLGVWFNKNIHSQSIYRTLELHIINNKQLQDVIITEIQEFCVKSQVKHLSKENNKISLILDVKIKAKHNKPFMDYLVENDKIVFFKI
jgi:putative Mg2+ transporter-C (MgtC) family protein